jgi:hypothetical protein
MRRAASRLERRVAPAASKTFAHRRSHRRAPTRGPLYVPRSGDEKKPAIPFAARMLIPSEDSKLGVDIGTRGHIYAFAEKRTDSAVLNVTKIQRDAKPRVRPV